MIAETKCYKCQATKHMSVDVLKWYRFLLHIFPFSSLFLPRMHLWPNLTTHTSVEQRVYSLPVFYLEKIACAIHTISSCSSQCKSDQSWRYKNVDHHACDAQLIKIDSGRSIIPNNNSALIYRQRFFCSPSCGLFICVQFINCV